MCASVHLNMGTSSGRDHIKPSLQLCPCTGQHSFQHTSDCFDYPCTKGSNVIHIGVCSENITLYIPPQEEI
jgi:hypothetical protein